MCRTLLFLTLFLLASVSAKKFSRTVDPFTSIKVCVPYTVQVAVSGTTEPYVINVDADDDVYSALQTDVSADGELVLTTSGDFDTGNPIKVIVKLPVDKLEGITVHGVGHVYVSGKFQSDSLKIVSGGAKSLYAPSLTVDKKLSVTNSGVGDVVLGSSLKGDIDTTLSGISKVYLIGVSGKVDVNLQGISNLGVVAANDVTIGGSVGGLGEIQYTGGTCTVSGRRFFSSPCAKVTSLDIVEESTTFKWTCGIQVKGDSVCGGNTSGATTYSDGTRSVSFASASSSGGRSSISSSSSGDGTSVSVSGDDASAVAVSNKKCNVPENDLFILDEA
eukprot:TRINITY_DN6961_c1_g1_i1.p1 TRINITY_DN6961_c1_g1~~TRINITY_DN6961_c1_g1_i1.p1  ORF type:complete len:371 (+),score=63.04 TRINITY_DN6961_c1_g1_i1:120-1115(+)